MKTTDLRKEIHQFEIGDRYFVSIKERSKKFHGEACIWFRPDHSLVQPYRAGVTVFKQTSPRIYESVTRTQQFFAHWRDAEAWSVEEYARLRNQQSVERSQ